MSPEDRRTSDAAMLAMRDLGDAILKQFRDEFAELRGYVEENYRTNATCDAIHATLQNSATEKYVEAVDNRAQDGIKELRRWIWGLAVLAIGSLLATVLR